MKILLINPSSSLINKSWAYKRFFTPIAPLGLAYIAGVLEKHKFNVDLIDQFATKITDQELFERVKSFAPDIVGFSALTPTVPDIERLVAGIRKLNKRITVVLGNIHSTCFPEEVLKENLADVVVRGEGELSMLELCQRMDQGLSWENLSGISFKSEGRIIHNLDREVIEDLDSLPLPAWHLLNLDNYREVPLAAINNSRAFPIAASRGCTYRCYYCSQDKIYKKVRLRNLKKVVDEMEFFNSNLGINFFGFSDAFFPFDEESGLEFCSLIMDKGLEKRLKWCTETRVDKVTSVLLKAMKKAGAHLIMYGVEVGNQKVLNSVMKDASLEQARFAFKETRRAKILSQGLFILGLPGETVKTCNETIKFAKELDCDIVKFNLAMPYPGSQFFEDYKNLLKWQNKEKFTSWHDWLNIQGDLIYTPEGIDGDTLRRLQRRAMFEFYVRPRVIFRNILKRTVTFKNIFFGGVWLLCLLYFEVKANLISFMTGRKKRLQG